MAERTADHSLFTLPQTTPFLPALAAAILAGQLPHPGGAPPDPLALARTRILLPSRRACRTLQEAFLALAPSGTLLPQIRPVGDVDEVLALASPHSPLAAAPHRLRPAVPDLERRLILTELVRAWSERLREAATRIPDEIADETSDAPLRVVSLSQATALARELMELMDEAELEGAELAKVQDLGGDFAEHWRLTVDFLKIITEAWPALMEAQQQMTAVARRDLLIRTEAARLLSEQPQTPVILAGEIGGVAATAELMAAVARLPAGAVVLPGLDKMLDAASWDAIVPDHPEHPQYGLKQFLDRLDARPEDVAYVSGHPPAPASAARLRLISETMRPAATTHHWHSLFGAKERNALAPAFAGLTLIETASEQEEAEVIALILRRAVETPDQTAALVTPDRRLARRVFARMEKWGLFIDDSGGEPLPRSRPGIFADLVLETVRSDFAPAALLALLKHPLTRLGRDTGKMRRAARALELLALRQHRLEDGLFAVKRNIERTKHRFETGEERHPVLRRLTTDDIAAAEQLIADIERVFADLVSTFRRRDKQPLGVFAGLHRTALVELAATPAPVPQPDLFDFTDAADAAESSGLIEPLPDPLPESSPESLTETVGELWEGEAGGVLAAFFDDLMAQTRPAQTTAREYAGLYRSLALEQVVRSRRPVHPRLHVWGPMEARLLSADILVLGALNEGSWPLPAEADAWLSRPMRAEVGLPAPERKIGRSAHDLAQVLGAPKVYMTRATKIDGVPSVPSRWLLRLQALATAAGRADALAPAAAEPWLAWARQRDRLAPGEKIGRPNPVPPLSARPRQLSVTRVEQWIANPYAIFARHILNLEPLPPLGREPDALLRGQIVHGILNEFSRQYPEHLPDDPGAALAGFAAARLDRLGDHPRVMAFWKPQLERFAEWFGETEPGRRLQLSRHLAEISGEMELGAGGAPFRLTARADRLDLADTGSLTIFDYKSRQMKAGEVHRLMAPQLPLEAAIALAGGFAGLGALAVADLVYISVLGREERGLETRCTEGDVSAAALAAEAIEGLKTLVAQYDLPEVGYPALRRSRFSYAYDDYEHLARIKEWAVEEDQ